MITPKQAYEAIKILHPDTHRITAYANRTQWLHQLFSTGSFSLLSISVDIDWGDTDQYPLPEPEWVDAVFPQDVGKEGRFSDNGKEWRDGTICGRWLTGWWISQANSWKFCQVRKVKT